MEINHIFLVCRYNSICLLVTGWRRNCTNSIKLSNPTVDILHFSFHGWTTQLIFNKFRLLVSANPSLIWVQLFLCGEFCEFCRWKMSRRSVIVDERFCFGDETHLPLHKTSVFVPGGDGFVVYNSTGEIIFRVDLYGPESGSNDELVLMDSAGGSLVTLHRKVSDSVLPFFFFFSWIGRQIVA